jgi:recombination associated protein RdgC
MPILGGSVSFARFRVVFGDERPKDLRRWLSKGLKRRAFEPIDRRSDEERAAGWVELHDPDATELTPTRLAHGERLLATWRVDKLQVPKQPLKAQLDAWIRHHSDTHGEPPKRVQIREQKDLIYRQLRDRAFPISRTFDLSWSVARDEVWVWSTSRKVVEEIQIALEEALEVSLQPLGPAARFQEGGVDPADLVPTAELAGIEISGTEASSRVES